MQDHAGHFQQDVQLFYVHELVERTMWTTVHHTVYVKLDAMWKVFMYRYAWSKLLSSSNFFRQFFRQLRAVDYGKTNIAILFFTFYFTAQVSWMLWVFKIFYLQTKIDNYKTNMDQGIWTDNIIFQWRLLKMKWTFNCSLIKWLVNWHSAYPIDSQTFLKPFSVDMSQISSNLLKKALILQHAFPSPSSAFYDIFAWAYTEMHRNKNLEKFWVRKWPPFLLIINLFTASH